MAWVIGVLPWTLGMIGFFKRGVLFKTEGCLVANGKGGRWCLRRAGESSLGLPQSRWRCWVGGAWVVVRGESDWRGVFGG